MPVEEALTEERVEKDRLNLYVSVALRERLRRAASARRTAESTTAVWLLEKALDRWESLSQAQREDL